MEKPRTTNLFNLVEQLQAQLDSLGLSPAQVDGVVTRKIRAYFQTRRA